MRKQATFLPAASSPRWTCATQGMSAFELKAAARIEPPHLRGRVRSFGGRNTASPLIPQFLPRPPSLLCVITVRRLRPPEWREYRDLRLSALAESPDAFGSTFARERLRSSREWEERLASGSVSGRDAPLVAQVDGDFVGLVWGRIDPGDPNTAYVFQMWVTPAMRGGGVGRALLEAVVDWAREADARTVLLGVTCGDTPARRMYERSGFVAAGEPVPLRADSVTLSQPMRLEVVRTGSVDIATAGRVTRG